MHPDRVHILLAFGGILEMMRSKTDDAELNDSIEMVMVLIL